MSVFSHLQSICQLGPQRRLRPSPRSRTPPPDNKGVEGYSLSLSVLPRSRCPERRCTWQSVSCRQGGPRSTARSPRPRHSSPAGWSPGRCRRWRRIRICRDPGEDYLPSVWPTVSGSVWEAGWWSWLTAASGLWSCLWFLYWRSV